VRDHRNCDRREKERLRYGAAFGDALTAQEEAGTVGPPSGSEHIRKVFSQHENLASARQRIT
jgi:hypothetical protein